MTLSTNDNDDFNMSETNTFGLTKATISNLETLQGYCYTNMSNMDSIREFISTHVHNYAHGSKQFSIDSTDTHAVAIRNKLQRLYADKVNGQSIFPLNDEKMENIITKHVYTGGKKRDERIAGGINQIIKKALGLAPSISYDVDGSTARSSGRYSVLASSEALREATMSKILIGEWFATSVDHYFAINSGAYVNTVVCVKPHSSDDILGTDIIASYDGYYKNNYINTDAMIPELGIDGTQTAIV